MGPGFMQLFGGAPVAPAFPVYIPLTLSANTLLNWPTELAPAGAPVVADIIDVTATSVGLSVQFSSAQQVSTGYSALFNNIGVNTFSVLDANSNTLAAIPSGQAWLLYLADNTTLQGVWRTFQFGAGVSNANAASLAGAGLKAITTTLNERILISTKSANYSVITADRATCIEWTGGSGGTLTIDPVALGSDFFCYVKNNGTGTVTVQPASGTIDGAASIVFSLGNSAAIVSDGTNLITIGLGQRVNSAFDFVQISLAGDSGNVVLSGAQLNRISYRFTGALAGNTTVVVPSIVQQYWVDNETTGAFSLTFSTGSGTIVTVPQGNHAILYCDGVNIVLAQTAGAVTFSNGSAASPSITFTTDQTTGLYLVSSHVLGLSTNGIQRSTVDGTGHWIVNSPDTSGAGTYTETINGPTPGGTALLLAQQLQSSISPALIVKGTGSNAFSVVSIVGNNGTSGTNDLSIFQNGSTLDASVLNNASAVLNLGTNGSFRQTINANGTIVIGPPAVSSGVALTVLGIAGAYVQQLTASGTSGASFGQFISAGTTSADISLLVRNQPGTTLYFEVRGDGEILGGGPVAGALVDMTPDTGIFAGAVTGMTAAVNYVCTWSRIGKLVTLNISGASGTSNSTSFTMTGLPAAIQPSSITTEIQLNPMRVFDNGSRVGTSDIVEAQIVSGSGTVTFLKGDLATGWTNSGTKGIGAADSVTLSYLLN